MDDTFENTLSFCALELPSSETIYSESDTDPVLQVEWNSSATELDDFESSEIFVT